MSPKKLASEMAVSGFFRLMANLDGRPLSLFGMNCEAAKLKFFADLKSNLYLSSRLFIEMLLSELTSRTRGTVAGCYLDTAV